MRPRGIEPHRYSDLWAKSHDWGKTFSEPVKYMIAMATDSPNSAVVVFDRAVFRELTDRRRLQALARIKRDHLWGFWKIGKVRKYFRLLPKDVRENLLTRLVNASGMEPEQFRKLRTALDWVTRTKIK